MNIVTIEEGEFAGWVTYPDEDFEQTAGPFYFRQDARGPVAAFRVEQKHMNGAGVAHGGLLMTFADYSLFAIAHDAMDGGYGLTVAFTSEFLDGPKLGELSSAQTHYCVRRAVQILGFGHDGLIEVPVDRGYRLDGDRLEHALERARSKGRIPLAVVGSAGSTSTGAIDPLGRIADFCEQHDLWFHVDGAHGASFVLSERERKALAGIERADSVVWDAHKTMLVSSLCTGVLFRDAGHLDRAFAQKAEYLFQPDPDSELTLDLGRHTIECTKPWLGLKLFTVLRSPGAPAIARYLEDCCETVRRFAEEVDRSEDFESAHSPDLNIFCFRYRPPCVEDATLDALQDEIRTAVIARTGSFLTRTALDDPRTGEPRVWLRITVLHPETTSETLRALLDELRKDGAARALRG